MEERCSQADDGDGDDHCDAQRVAEDDWNRSAEPGGRRVADHREEGGPRREHREGRQREKAQPAREIHQASLPEGQTPRDAMCSSGRRTRGDSDSPAGQPMAVTVIGWMSAGMPSEVRSRSPSNPAIE